MKKRLYRERVVCENKRQDGTLRNLYGSDLDEGCRDCFFVRTHRGKHYTEDWVKCTAPVDMEYEDKVDIFPQRIEKVRKYKREFPTACK